MEKQKNNIYVTQSSIPTLDEYVDEIREIWDNHQLTNMGKKHEQLQDELKKYLETDNLSLFTNGHLALESCLESLNIRGEIITTPFTFVSTIHAIVRSGNTPVFCDINSENFTIDSTKIEELITPNTIAILAVHVYGNVCDVLEIERIARENNLVVIYDSAHAFGVRICGHSIVNYGDYNMFSFHATKVFNTIEGGAIVAKYRENESILKKIKNFGINGPEDVELIGTNAKMNEFQAAMGLCNLRNIHRDIEKRKEIHNEYMLRLKDIEHICLPLHKDAIDSNYAYFPILIKKNKLRINRDHLYEALKNHGIYSRKYFYPLITELSCYKGKFDSDKTPVAFDTAQSILTLPLYSELSLNDVDMICDTIRNIFYCQ